ncbi:FecR family protein [Flammeovirga pectinis]|uniref:FecR family protein n=1 Tax=Flammeovirga pectinis TaxID=2494373 RepID=A0A3S9P714_9BACT|nr:FecR family protein [Flammeovirga pectinis]AZQ63862.1 FecR family protein [Flammeovirga pectinis]
MKKKEVHIVQLIAKSLTEKLSDEEQETLNQFLTVEENTEEFAAINTVWEDLEHVEFNAFDKDVAWEQFETLKAEKKSNAIQLQQTIIRSIAAVLLLFVGIGWYTYQKTSPMQTEVSVWTTDGGETVMALATENAKHSNDLIELNVASVDQIDGDGIDEIHVPAGKRISVVLSDSSKIWLASGSTFKFPRVFKGATREVEISGKAYFEVHRDVKHPFIVKGHSSDITVLGTEFCVDNTNPKREITTLVEGSVALTKDGATLGKLKPNEQAILTNKSETIEITQVDAKSFVDWKEGVLRIIDKPFLEFQQDLEQWYGVKIINNNKQLVQSNFTGSFDQRDNIHSVMQLIESLQGVHYYMKGDTVIIH